MSNKLLKTTDLKVVRAYKYKGIRIILEINYLSKKVSVVEYNHQSKGFVPKKFLFAERQLEYMEGWKLVFKGLELATDEAIRELEAIKEKEMNETIDSLLAYSLDNLNNFKPKK